MIKSACKNCTIRHIGCHSTCNSYKQFRQDMDKAKEEERKFADKNEAQAESKRRKWIAGR